MINKFFVIIIIFIFSSLNSIASNLVIKGLSKLNIDDLQTFTSIDLNKNFYSKDEVNLLLKEFYKSDLIFDIEYYKENDIHNLIIQENKLVENIYINGNIRIDDKIILQNISIKKNGFLNKNYINNDINIIKSIYGIKGFNNVNVAISSEKFSNDRVNLIYDITENNQSEIDRIKFQGNTTFSDRYLLSLINSKTRNFYNIFSSGSNLNIENFNFDINKIKSFYTQKGFFDADVTFTISETSSNRYTVIFFINEGKRLKLDDIYIDKSVPEISKKINDRYDRFIKKLSKNDYYYDQFLIDEFLEIINKILMNNNEFNTIFVSNLEKKIEKNILAFNKKIVKPSRINKIDITGNNITKDKTIRSKLSFEPGDYLNINTINDTKTKLLRSKYINKVDVINNNNNGMSDITINIDENVKTGQFLVGGTFSGDNGAGLTIAAKDNNLFGSGNTLDTNITSNQESTFFNISLLQYPLSSSNIRNSYTIFNTEKDLSNSFGFKTDELGVGYSINFDYSQNIDITSGLAFKKSDRHSAKKSITSINENIGKFDIYTINLSLKHDTTNDLLYPTDGASNSIFFEYSPKDISDDSYYKIIIRSDFYRKSKNSNRFLFFSNDLGSAESLEGNLSTVNAFSLGGLNFKGYEYKGVGPKQNDIYLGGNKFFTSTVGYGGSFLFDDKDNINTKLFYTVGSIWDSDYTTDNKFDIRSSAGISFDILTAIGPISLIYAVPIDKNNDDKTNEFNFSIGTSF